MLDSLKSAYARLSQLEGSDASHWTWGRIHTVTFHHPLESIAEMKRLVNLGPISRPGDNSTIMNTGSRRGSLEQVSGPTWKQILDVGAWDNSVMINAPGQSGQPGSPHYADLLPLWDQGQHIPMLYSRDAVEKHASQRQRLEPGP